MAFKGNAICTSFKKELLEGKHVFPTHTFMLALYGEDASLDSETTDYTSDNEIAATGGYTAGGIALTPTAPTSGSRTAWVDFADLIISGAHQARGGLIYNATADGGVDTTEAVCVLDFGSLKTSASEFEIKFPTADWINAIVRVQ